jgi:hypothetical protein
MTPEDFFKEICQRASQDDPEHVPDVTECRITMTESYAADANMSLEARLADAVKTRLGQDGLQRYWPLIQGLQQQIEQPEDDMPHGPIHWQNLPEP